MPCDWTPLWEAGPKASLLNSERYAAMDALAKKESATCENWRILEIGSWCGASALLWAQYGTVFCVDAWKPYVKPEHHGVSKQFNEDTNLALRNGSVFARFLKNTARSDRIHPLVGWTRAILPILQSKYFHMVYIDGSHAYSDVAYDIAQARRLVRDDGIICGDDLELQINECEMLNMSSNSERDYVIDTKTQTAFHPGVTRAVSEAFGYVESHAGFWVVHPRCSYSWIAEGVTTL